MYKTDGLTEKYIARIINCQVCSECGALLKRSIENGCTVIICERFREHQGIANPYEKREYEASSTE